MADIMIDLETLDTESSAVVTSIGAVEMDFKAGTLGKSFYAEFVLDLDHQQRLGRTLSANTVAWWMRQSDEARKLFAEQVDPKQNRVTTYEGLLNFYKFVNDIEPKSCKIWGNGADFDNVILGSLYASFNLPKPWSYGNNRCYRTAYREFDPNPPQKLNRIGTHHNALDDAVSQATALLEIMKCRRSQ